MSRRHADIRSHAGHYLVDPYTWSWSPNGQDHIWHWKLKCHGHGQGQTQWSHLRLGVQSIYLPFVSWQSDHFWLKYRKFHIWPWKFKVKVMAKVKSDSYIWGPEFNRYVCFSFHGIGSFLAEIEKILYLTLKIQGHGHDQGQTWLSYSIDVFAFRFVVIGPFWTEI